ncbi:MAG: hypothetical protein KBT36_09575 [Kurthia sp.]|nr:hypothetical protein [Candidatus Kurthia equi]
MKKLLIPLLTCTLLLSACTSPNYGEDKETPYEPIVIDTEVISMYGVVVEVTEDNQLKLKVNRPEEVEAQGIQVNSEGIVKVALAAVNSDKLNSEELSSLSQFLKSRVLHDEVLVEVPKNEQLEEVEGYVSFTTDNDGNLLLLQDLLANEFFQELIDNEAVSQIKPYLDSIQSAAKDEIIKILNMPVQK